MATTTMDSGLEVDRDLQGERPRAPRVRGMPVIGSAAAFLADPVRFLLAAYREHGPVFRIRLGPAEYTVIAGVEGSAFVLRSGRDLVTSEGIFDEPARIFGAATRANLASVDGDAHAAIRSLFREGMSRTAGRDAFAPIASIARASFADHARSGASVDAVDLARRLTFEQLGHAMAGGAPEGMFESASTVLDAIVRGTRVPLFQRLPLPPSTRRAAAHASTLTRALFEKLGDDAPSFLREIELGLSRGLFEKSDLAMLMMAPFIAGLDTMAHTFGFVLYRLARHPEWRARLVAELESVAGPTLDDAAIARCPELAAFVQEVMRIHPLSPGVLRFATRDFVVGGYRIAAGDRLMFPHTMPHLMEEYFPDPERFDPERFLGERAKGRGAHRYSPFGVGPHMCLGAGLAEYLLRVDVAELLHAYDVVDADPRYRLRVSNTSGARPVGFRVRIVPRSDSETRGDRGREAVER